MLLTVLVERQGLPWAAGVFHIKYRVKATLLALVPPKSESFHEPTSLYSANIRVALSGGGYSFRNRYYVVNDSIVHGTPVSLENCEDEPIHIPGTIQPHGFLLALTPDWLVSHVSENIETFTGLPAEKWLGNPIERLIADPALHTLRNQAASLREHDAVQRSFSLSLIDGKPPFDVALHFAGKNIVIEAEPAVSDDREAAALVRAMVGRLKHTSGMPAFLRDGARHVQALTGFDRVMIYRFDADNNGEVVAESLRGKKEPYYGLHYPASDIPVQARTLYLRNSFRIIADVAVAPVRIQVENIQAANLDQSLSVLRAVSPIHIEYLKNMDVAASLSISIIVSGKLWGLFACHHGAPRLPSFAYRTAAELFGEMFSLMLESRLRMEASEHDARAHALALLLIAETRHDDHLLHDPQRLSDLIFDTIPGDGLCIQFGGVVSLSGSTPSREQCSAITAKLAERPVPEVVAVESLATFLPLASNDQSAGFIAVPLMQNRGDFLLIFRGERARTVKWAGNPEKDVSSTGSGLTPRKSFMVWTELVWGRCLPFSTTEQRAAEIIRIAMLEATLRAVGGAAGREHAIAGGVDLLISELNHRVRNILALVRGLISQANQSVETSDGFISTLDQRVQSLARAHDQITRDRWGPARLRDLVDTEAEAYLGAGLDRVQTTGPNVLLLPIAFTTLALVFHELMTNAAKYGALSSEGRVQVDWQVDAEGDLLIDWKEVGGPLVSTPLRRGFGSTVIERTIPYDLGGSAATEYLPQGVQAHFRIPSRHLGGISAEVFKSPISNIPYSDQLLTGLKVLLVEDNLIIAMDCADSLRSLGSARVDTAASSAAALAAIEGETYHFALLDYSLGSETSIPVADALARRGIPFAFATGHDGALHKSGHESVPVIGKPYGKKHLVPLLVRLGFGIEPSILSAANPKSE